MVLLNYMIAFFGTAAGMTIAASMINGFGFEPEDFEFFTSVQFFIIIITIEGLGMADVPRAFGSFDSLRKNLTLMMYLENQAFMGSYAYDRAAAASVIQLGIYLLIAGIVYFILIRDKDEAKLKKMARQQKREAAILKQT